MDQLAFKPLAPKPGTVRESVLTVLQQASPLGVCRMEWARDHDIYEISNRVGELQQMGWLIGNRLCERHYHRARITEYFIER